MSTNNGIVIEFFVVVHSPHSSSITVYGAGGSRSVPVSAGVERALGARGRSHGLRGWRRRATAEKELARRAAHFPGDWKAEIVSFEMAA
jgi:hypothetical protein